MQSPSRTDKRNRKKQKMIKGSKNFRLLRAEISFLELLHQAKPRQNRPRRNLRFLRQARRHGDNGSVPFSQLVLRSQSRRFWVMRQSSGLPNRRYRLLRRRLLPKITTLRIMTGCHFQEVLERLLHRPYAPRLNHRPSGNRGRWRLFTKPQAAKDCLRIKNPRRCLPLVLYLLPREGLFQLWHPPARHLESQPHPLSLQAAASIGPVTLSNA